MNETVEVRVIDKHFAAYDKLLTDKYNWIQSIGSSRSGKTYQAVLWSFLLCLEADPKKPLRIVYCRKESSVISRTIYKDFVNAYRHLGLTTNECIQNKSTMSFHFPYSNSEIFALGLNDSGKLHGLACDFALIDEAIECDYLSVLQVNQRCERGVILCYNPSLTKSWITDNIQNREDCFTQHSTYKDNPYLPQRIIDQLESYNPNVEENVIQGSADERMYKIYCLGEPCGLDGQVFKDWKYHKPSEFPSIEESESRFYAIDYGYSNDPTAMIEIRKCRGVYYVKSLIYETGLQVVSINGSKDSLEHVFTELGIEKGVTIIAESAEPKSNDALIALGYSVMVVQKYAGSIMDGINLIKSNIISVEAGSTMDEEYQNYTWKKKPNGDPISPPRPVDNWNHNLDALRYYFLTVVRRLVDSTGKSAIAEAREKFERTRSTRQYGQRKCLYNRVTRI